MQSDQHIAHQRLLDRDGDTPDNRAFITAWTNIEDPFMRIEQPWTRTTITVAGTAPNDSTKECKGFHRDAIFLSAARSGGHSLRQGATKGSPVVLPPVRPDR